MGKLIPLEKIPQDLAQGDLVRIGVCMEDGKVFHYFGCFDHMSKGDGENDDWVSWAEFDNLFPPHPYYSADSNFRVNIHTRKTDIPEFDVLGYEVIKRGATDPLELGSANAG